MQNRVSRDKAPVATPPKQDKRRTPRLDIDRTVQALIGGTTIACKLSDVSKSGARLSLNSAKSLPDEFELLLNDDIHKWCRVVRRSEKQVGIKFIPAPASAEAPPTTASSSSTP